MPPGYVLATAGYVQLAREPDELQVQHRQQCYQGANEKDQISAGGAACIDQLPIQGALDLERLCVVHEEFVPARVRSLGPGAESDNFLKRAELVPEPEQHCARETRKTTQTQNASDQEERKTPGIAVARVHEWVYLGRGEGNEMTRPARLTNHVAIAPNG